MACPMELKNLFISIFNAEDVYISIYLIQKVYPACEFFDNELLSRLGDLIQRYKNVKYKFIELSSMVKQLLKYKISSRITIDIFVDNLYEIYFDDDEIVYYRKLFGYSQIYKCFKDTLKNIFLKKIHYKKIGLILRLLDNFELAYNGFLPIFERTTKYVEKELTDRNILQCIEIHKASIEYNSAIFDDKPDYIIAVTSYIISIFSDPNNFKFLSLQNTKDILDGVNIFVHYCINQPRMKDITMGIFKDVYDTLKRYIKRKTTVFEEYVCLTCLMEILYIYYDISYNLGSRMFDYDEIFTYIQEIELIHPKSIGDNDYKIVYGKFHEVKYKILDFLAPKIKEAEFNKDIFNRDLRNVPYSYDLIKNINNLCQFIEWNDIIDLACNPIYSEDYIELLFKEYYFETNQNEHYEFIMIYLISLFKNNMQDLILFATSFLINHFKECLLNVKQVSLILELYFCNIDDNTDSRVLKRRLQLSNFIYYRMNRSSSEVFLKEFIKKLNDTCYNKFDINVMILFLIVSKKDKELPDELLNEICAQFIAACIKEYERYDEFTYEIKINLAIIIDILCYHKKEILFDKMDYCPNLNTYFKIIIGMICYINEITTENYLTELKKYILNFLLNADVKKRNEIGVLLKRCDQSMWIEVEDDHELIELCKFIKSKIDML